MTYSGGDDGDLLRGFRGRSLLQGATIEGMERKTLPLSEAVLEAAAEYGQRLRSRFGKEVAAIRLFGSYARGEAHEESDVDIAVVLDSVDWATRREVIDLATEVGLARELHLSPTLFDRTTFELWRRQERALVVDILREGVQV